MKHGRSVENVALGLHARATFSTSGSSYLNVTLTTVHHLYNDIKIGGNNWRDEHAAHENRADAANLLQTSRPVTAMQSVICVATVHSVGHAFVSNAMFCAWQSVPDECPSRTVHYVPPTTVSRYLNSSHIVQVVLYIVAVSQLVTARTIVKVVKYILKYTVNIW